MTLEIALLNVPHFICYRVSPLTYGIMSRLVKIPYVGLCNIITGKKLITEIIQDEVTVDRLEEEIHDRLMRDDSQVVAAKVGQEVRSSLGPAGGAHNAAEQILVKLDQ